MNLDNIKDNNQSKIFILSGKAESGKTTCGEMIKTYYESQGKKVLELSYAKYLKQYAKDYFNWDGSEETKPRKLLQVLGTDIIRQKLDMPYFHVDRICEDVEILSYFYDIIIIPDGRFPNEIEIPSFMFGLDRVITIRMIRDNHISKLTNEQLKHISECALDNYLDFDYVINAKNIKELEEKINNIIKNIEE